MPLFLCCFGLKKGDGLISKNKATGIVIPVALYSLTLNHENSGEKNIITDSVMINATVVMETAF